MRWLAGLSFLWRWPCTGEHMCNNATGGAVFVTSKEDANIRCLLSL
jgi:hypothetical protein